VKVVNKLRILLILDQPTTLQSSHSTEGGILAVALPTLVVVEELAEGMSVESVQD
jgi:hypothetical protein